jgi:hypothetical protein
MKRIVRLTESDLTRIVRRVISEQTLPFAKYADYLTFENASDMSGAGSEKVYASLGSTVTANKTLGQKFGNTITVNADVYTKKEGTWSNAGKQTISFVQHCGAQANNIKQGNRVSDTPGWISKPNGAIQNKLAASCKAQGYTGSFQRPAGQWVS